MTKYKVRMEYENSDDTIFNSVTGAWLSGSLSVHMDDLDKIGEMVPKKIVIEEIEEEQDG